MTDGTKSLTTVNQTAQVVSSYGSGDDVRALAQRIMTMHPSARSIGPQGCNLLAQLGLALGLNPLPGTGHIHAWSEGGQLCVHIGVEGRMALARKDSPFSVYTRAMTAQEVEEHGLQPGDRGKVAEVTRLDIAQQMKDLGVTIRPFTGVGIAKANERAPKGRTLAWRAEQRAIKDALRLAYSLRLPADIMGQVVVVEHEGDGVSRVIDQEDGAGTVSGTNGNGHKNTEQAVKDKRDGAALWGEPQADPGPAYTPALAPEVEEGEVTEPSPVQADAKQDGLDDLDLSGLKDVWRELWQSAPKGQKPMGLASGSADQWRTHIRAYRAKLASPQATGA